MMNDKYLAPISKAEKSKFFEKIFREHHIACITGLDVFRVALKDHMVWLRQRISRYFTNPDCTCYVLGRHVIIWKGYSNEPIFMAEIDEPFDVFSIGKCDFLLRRFTANGEYLFSKYQWVKEKNTYLETEYEPSVVPDEYCRISEHECHRPITKHQWNRIYPHHDEETRSIDNRIFYDFIVKYWE